MGLRERFTELLIDRVGPASTAEWKSAYAQDAQATFFHGPSWSELWAEYTRGELRPRPLRVRFSDGCIAVVGITAAPTRVPGIRRACISPQGCPGGWVAAAPLNSGHHAALTRLVASHRELVWRTGPSDATALEIPVAGTTTEDTHLVDLRDGVDAARSRWKAPARRQMKSAQREGLTVRRGGSARDGGAYESLYRHSVARWERPLKVHRPELFALLPRVAGEECQLWLAERDGVSYAGAVIFVHGVNASYWHGASARHSVRGAMNLLQWEVLDALAAEGVERYDLLGSGPLRGVVAFKESIGGIRTPVRLLVRTHPAVALARAADRRLPRRPDALARSE